MHLLSDLMNMFVMSVIYTILYYNIEIWVKLYHIQKDTFITLE